MLILMGKSASGKTVVRDQLVEKYKFNPIVTYTTRPMRKGEVPDITYHYISKDDFLKKINDGFFAEWKKYKVDEDIWYYGTAKVDIDDADDNSVIILTPDGVRDVTKCKENIAVIYLYANTRTIKDRLLKRNDSNDKIEDRMKRDSVDFKNAEFLADKIVYNNEEMNFENVVENVVTQYRRVLNK